MRRMNAVNLFYQRSQKGINFVYLFISSFATMMNELNFVLFLFEVATQSVYINSFLCTVQSHHYSMKNCTADIMHLTKQVCMINSIASKT